MSDTRVTKVEGQAIATNLEAETNVTKLDASALSNAEPSEVHVTHLYENTLVNDEPGGARVTHLYVNVLVIPGEQPPALNECDLILEVFDDDRQTIRWRATTNINFPEPLLVLPDRYAEQEIDPAAGSASLGTVSCTVADAAIIPSDQDSGWVTSKLAKDVLADIHGRRARLLRAVAGEAAGETVLEVVIDGVAGPPRMDQTYAAFSIEVRDTRESERKVRCFEFNSVFATRGILPDGPFNGYGYNPETGMYLLDPPSGPLLGKFLEIPGLDTTRCGYVSLTADPGNDVALRTISQKAADLFVCETTTATFSIFLTFNYYFSRCKGIVVQWRAQGSSDPWTTINDVGVRGNAGVDFNNIIRNLIISEPGSENPEIEREVLFFYFGDLTGVSSAVPFEPEYGFEPSTLIPTIGQDIEFRVLVSRPPSEDFPAYVEFITAGQFTKNVYDGVYSARDEEGNIVPTGILYDADAVLQMTDPVRMRITEPITDARDWLEKYIYTPTGWIPAIDRYGRISPVSQEAPEDIFSLPLIWDAITEPAPEWSSGERIVNIIQFTYPRDYIPLDPENAETGDGLADIDVIIEFQDPYSIERHGPQVLEIDGRAFRALGTTGEYDGSVADGEPLLLGGLTVELGWMLANERRQHVLNRYALGAPTMVFNVRRDLTPTLRAGSWIRVWLSWFPDYVTQRRGLVCLAQVVAIGDLDCVWRHLTIEQVVPLELYGDEEVHTVILIDDDGKILTDDDGAILTELA